MDSILLKKDEEIHQLRKLLERERCDKAAAKDEIDALQKTNADLRYSLKDIRRPSSEDIQPCFLLKAPLEIRTMIYKLLLTNTDLGTAAPYTEEFTHGGMCGANYKFNLSPALLATCHQVYEEALPILYQNNDFFFTSLWHRCGHYLTNLPSSPLTRYMDPKPYDHNDARAIENYFDWRNILALKHIRRWKIFLGYSANVHDLSMNAYTFFFRAIASLPIQFLEVVVFEARYPSDNRTDSWVSTAMDQMEDACLLFKDLREVRELVVRLPLYEDIPKGFISSPCSFPWPDKYKDLGRDLSVEVKEDIDNNSTRPRLFEMLDRLLTYAKTFEREPTFKADLGSAYSLSLPSLLNPFKLDLQDRFTLQDKLTKYNHYHTVEKALDLAVGATLSHVDGTDDDEADMALFKKKRRVVIKYLEPQFKDITEAITKMHAYIRKEVLPYTSGYEAEAFVALQEFSTAFQRKLDHHIKVIILQKHTRFDHAYDELPREKAMKRMLLAVKGEDYTGFEEDFIFVTGDMYAQYLEMYRARKELFDSDGELKDGPDIDVSSEPCVPPIDWNEL